MDKGMEALKRVLDDDAVVHIKDAAKRAGEYTKPFKIGYPIFDEAMKGGVREGNLIVGTGISGDGKTTMFQNISVNLSKEGYPCVWFSYEELIDNLYAKFKGMGIPGDVLKVFAPKQLSTGNNEWIQEKIKEGIDKHNTKFVFIDHIDFLAPKKGIRNNDQKRMVLQNICLELKSMAIELEIVIFLIAHVKKVQGRAVEMQDISESGDIYKLADAVFCVERHVAIEQRGGRKVEVAQNSSSLRMLKNRIGGDKPYMDFYLENNVIMPIGMNAIENKDDEEDGEILVVFDEDKEKEPPNLFGTNND